MPLHRDIYWVGRQWAVTGNGMQAVDQRLKGKYDIDIARLWDDDLPQSLQADGWLNIDDFRKGLATARARYPEPPEKVAAREAAVAAVTDVSTLEDVCPAERPSAQEFELRIEGAPAQAKFASPWRIFTPR